MWRRLDSAAVCVVAVWKRATVDKLWEKMGKYMRELRCCICSTETWDSPELFIYLQVIINISYTWWFVSCGFSAFLLWKSFLKSLHVTMFGLWKQVGHTICALQTQYEKGRRHMSCCSMSCSGSFPDSDTGFLLLSGLSNGTFR